MEEEITKLTRTQRELLLLEREENLDNFFKDLSSANLRNLERNGQAFTKLSVSNIASKGSGRFQIDFTRADDLPFEHGLNSGDLVLCLRQNQKNLSVRGIITSVSESSVSITASESFDDLQDEETFSIIKADSDITYKCQIGALSNLEKKNLYNQQCYNIIKILFEKDGIVTNDLLVAEDSIPKEYLINDEIQFINSKLADDQKSAVLFALKRRYFAIIQGPPGTGKTTTLIELIIQLHRFKKKILVCAPTNVAVDNIVTRLGETEAKPLRLGHPSRISKTVQQFSLDAYIQSDDSYTILRDIERSMKELTINAENGKGQNYKQMRELKKEHKKRLSKLTCEILKRSSVILCTLNSATKYEGHLKNVPEDYFDIVIVDEASQALEASMWIAIPNAAKLIMAGDINQLPPVVMCQEALNRGLSLSLMERAIKKLGKKCFVCLTRQYRMHEKIMFWSSKSFYQNTLQADKSVKNHLLKDLVKVQENAMTNEALIFINTCGCECEEYRMGDDARSKGNPGEAVIVEKVVTSLIQAGISHKDVGVITPYALQVNFIQRSLAANSIHTEVSTVDGFQGREKEVIILSLVRSNQERELGFVTDFRRLNVAVTRARRLLVLIADSETMEKNELIAGLLKHIEENGLLQTAEEYLADAIDVKEQIEKSSQKPIVKSKVKSSAKTEKKKNTDVKHKHDDKSVKLTDRGSNLSSCLNMKKYNIFESIKVDESNDTNNILEEEYKKPAESSEISKKRKKKKKTENVRKEKDENITESDNFDEIVAEFTKSNYICSFESCKISTQLVKITCQFCKRWYCLQHGMQEIHGCGEAVRQKERKNFRHRIPAAASQRDKQKFARKLKELEEARKPKKKTAQE